MLADTSNDHTDSSLYTLRYRLREHIVYDLRKAETPSVLESSPCDNWNVHINHYCRITLQRREIHLVELVTVHQGSYEKALSYEDKRIEDNWEGWMGDMYGWNKMVNILCVAE